MRLFLKIVVLLIVFMTLFGFFLFLPEETQCDLSEIIVKDDVLSVKWKKLWQILPPALPKEGAQDALGIVYENGNNILQHKVYKYRNSLNSYIYLRINNEVFFPSSLVQWTDLTGAEDWRLHGDETRIQCRNGEDHLLGYKCSAVIRYGQFISEFSSPIEEDVLSQEEFKVIVIGIDNVFASCLE